MRNVRQLLEVLGESHLDPLRQFDGLADVAGRRHCPAGAASPPRVSPATDEGMQRIALDALAARQFLQLLVGILDAVAAHHRLHRLGQHFPAVVEIFGQPLRVGFELVEAAQAGIVGQQRVAEGDAHVAQHRRVGQVALQARDRQLLGQVPQQRVGEAEIAFGVLEIDRIDLVRHGRRADLAGLGLSA